MNPVEIHTQRLLLKGFTPEDMYEVFTTMTKTQIMSLLGHSSEEEYRKEEVKFKLGYASYNRRFVLFLLIENSTKNIVGRCGLHNWNKEHFRAEIGYSMEVESAKKQGYMSEAVEAILRYSFSDLHLHRVEAMVSPTNVPSLRILQKFGFIQEGRLREHFKIGEHFEDSLFFSLLAVEYFKGPVHSRTN
jgi:ribosomal-protein-alanine N-acetyltransferase